LLPLLAHNGSASRNRASVRGDLIPQYRKTAFGQKAFSARVVGIWNFLPINIISNDSFSFKKKTNKKNKNKLKYWRPSEQICNH